ncbi:Hypothetical protein Cp262_0312 [Corynebacterium pseudotuberculosis]|uniref:hypothetical protein n=1 Tax=Corynebacterium pseudotuberculosis TaxID=1719 RepID=UPI00065E2784|nr:hypothetical protein [Corynebacterium pseudotuberculosis]AKP07980.1 Hypothetical protein Cp262_0312 [Corynebacterium pseudotuberculosis]
MRKQRITTRIGRPLVGVGLAAALCGLQNPLGLAQEAADPEPTAALESNSETDKNIAHDFESIRKKINSFTLPIGSVAPSDKEPTLKPSESTEDLPEEPETLEGGSEEESEFLPETLEKKLIKEGKKLEASDRDNSKLNDQEVRSLWEKLIQKTKAPQKVLRKGDMSITIPGQKTGEKHDAQNVASLVVTKEEKDVLAANTEVPQTYASGEALLAIGDAARVPGALLGLKEKKDSAPVWYLPQEKDANPDAPSVGFNFEQVSATKKITVSLADYHGPGRMVTAEMGEEKAETAFDSQDLEQAWEYEGGASYHQAFAFTEPGAYTATFKFLVEDQESQGKTASQEYSFNTTFLVGSVKEERVTPLKEIVEKSVNKKPLKEKTKETDATETERKTNKDNKKEQPKAPGSQEPQTSVPKTPETDVPQKTPEKDPENVEPETKQPESKEPRAEEHAPSVPSPIVPVDLKGLAKEIRELDRELNAMSRQTDSLFKAINANEPERKQEQRRPASNASGRTETGGSEQGSGNQNAPAPVRSSSGGSSGRGSNAAKPNKPRNSAASGSSSAKSSDKNKESSKDKKKSAKKSTEKKASAKSAKKTTEGKTDEAQGASNEKIAATGESMRKRGWWTGFLFGLGAMAMLGGVVFFTQARNIAKRK